MPSWFEVTVDVPSELCETVTCLLCDLGSPGVEHLDHGDVTSLVAYFQDSPPFDDLRRLCTIAGTAAGQTCSPVIRSRTIDEQNWAEDWKNHFRPIAVGHRLLVAPPWDVPPAGDRIVIVIEPAMAFGTGQHPTTRGCLELIENVVTTRRPSRGLDVGTGSGILAIAMAGFGIKSVYALDNDPAACHAAAANSERNGTTAALSVTDNWRDVVGPFDLITANLFTNLLCDLADRLQNLLVPGGTLICSGFLASDEGTVAAAYSALRPVRRCCEGGWVTLLLDRAGPAS